MIPKIIHACWLGKAEMPADQKAYVEGWHRLLPDYEIILWTDETFQKYYDDSLFVKEAIKRKKYGFLADYFRFTVLYEFGGIYMDTDVELLRRPDEFLNCKMFMGYIFDSSIGTAVIGTEKHNPLMLEWRDILERDFEEKGEFTVSNDWVTAYFLRHFPDFRLTGDRQSLAAGIELYPKDYFERYRVNKKSGGGYAEHHCAGSWSDAGVPLYKRILKKLLPRSVISRLGHRQVLPKTVHYQTYRAHKRMKKAEERGAKA